jgi:hypothetical protein
MVEFRDFIIFLKNPNIGEQFDIKSITFFLKLVWKSFLIIIAIDVIIGILFVIPLRYLNLYPSLKVINLTPINILKVSLLLPVVEELIFRLPLRISKINFLTSFCLILFLVLYKHYISNIYLVLSLLLIYFFFFYLFIKKETFFFNKLTVSFSKYFRLIFYFQAFVFGFLHLTNYTLDFKYFYLLPFFAISYILSGCFWGYIRVRYSSGIFVCIASHIVVNCIYCLMFAH